NKSLYSLLYPVVLAYEYLIPHFGWFYQQSLDKTLIYTNMQLDQRNIRDKLKQVDLPVLVLHALDDRYVPLSAGEENHRLLPQSYFITEKARHLDIKDEPGLWSKHIEWFIKLAEEGRADTRLDAGPDRIAYSEEPFDPQKMDTISGWGLAMIMLLLAIISLVSEDLSCIAGGLVVASGILDFEYALLACFAGIFLADINIYFLGRWVGRPITGWIPFKWFIQEADIERMEELYEMRGVEIIFASRFLPGTRFPAYLAAGLLRINFLFFLGYFLLSLIIWTPLMVWLSALIGQPMLSYLDLYQDYAIWIILAIILILYGIFKVLIPLSTVKGRRKLVTKWKLMKEKISEF
ncbi:MAG: VTT domain-containing protein, partial [Balneolaceae bacterium]